MADEGFAAFMTSIGDSGAKESSVTDTSTALTPANGGNNKPTDDEYSYEEEQEREAMMKSYHHPMKQWFRQDASLTTKYGQYPLFWQDLKTWTPYRDVLKEFLRVTEHGDKPTPNGDAAPLSTRDASATTESVSTGEVATTDASADATTAASVPTSSAAATSEDDPNAPKRRRKSRWGDEVAPVPSTEPATTSIAPPPQPLQPPLPPNDPPPTDATGERRRKKSRWAPPPAVPTAAAAAAAAIAAAAIPAHLRATPQQQQSLALRAQLDVIAHQLTTVAADAARLEKDPNRSPSPPPQYDNSGKRTNTREVRMRAALEKKRQTVMDELVKVNPLYRPPADYTRQKLTRKIYIPIKDYPGYNFIGLIIGPRGNTQKRMEKESNCKIAIRGKGSVKEGSRGKKALSDENDDLHVLITAENEADLEAAAKDVTNLLVPIDDTKNAHKQKQLRELALINGTLRDDDFCHLCGEKGHRQFECPNREQYNTFRAANVRCAICGDSSHPTRDCTQKRKSAAETAAIDAEYNSFLQQLGEKPVISSATAGASSSGPMPPTTSTSTGSPAGGTPHAPHAPAAPAPAPWLQPAKGLSSTTTQPWMLKQSVGAPGTATAPGMHHAGTGSGPPVLGSTPETAFPPAVAPSAAAYGYAAHPQHAWGAAAQQQQQWGGAEYYYSAEYQQQYAQYGHAQSAAAAGYGHYGPPAGAAVPPHVAAVGATGAAATSAPAAPAAASAANYYQQYQQQYPQQQQQQQYYQHPPPQQ